MAGDEGGVWPSCGLLVEGKRTAATGFFIGVDFAGCGGLDCDTLASAAFIRVDPLGAEFSLMVETGLAFSCFLVTGDAVAAGGFLATAAGCGRPTSFLAAAAAAVEGLGGCVAAVLPLEGAVATLEVLAFEVALVDGLTVVVVGLDVVDVIRVVEGPAAGLVVFEAAAAAAALAGFAVVEVLVFRGTEAATLLVVAVVLGLALLIASVTGLFLGTPFTAAGLVPLVPVAAGAEEALAGPAGRLSGTLVWFLAVEEAAATPAGLLGKAPAAEGLDVVVAVLPASPAAAGLLLAVRCEAAPGRELAPQTPEEVVDCVLL